MFHGRCSLHPFSEHFPFQQVRNYTVDGHGSVGARHAESRLLERPVTIGIDNIIDVTGDATDHLNVGLAQKIEKGVAHRPADDDSDADPVQLPRAFKKGSALHRNRLASHYRFVA
jgi:hypothetical protein